MRTIDRFFVAFFAFAGFFALTMDAVSFLVPTMPIERAALDAAPWPPTFIKRFFWFWASTYDPQLIENPFFAQFYAFFSPAFHLPFYCYAIATLASARPLVGRRRALLHTVGTFWSGVMFTIASLFLVVGLGYGDVDVPPQSAPAVLAAYGPFVIVPLLFAARLHCVRDGDGDSGRRKRR